MTEEKYGFVYIWYDIKHKRFYIGCHWGHIHDGYICSSNWMRDAYNRRPQDFRRRIIKTNLSREDMYVEEQRYLSMIDSNKISPNSRSPRYYNLHLSSKDPWHKYDENIKTIGQKISASKKGKKFGRYSKEHAKAISDAKKGKPLTEEHKAALTGIKKSPHTDEWKAENSKRLKEQWDNGTRKRATPKNKMTAEEQAALSATRLKSKWADPIWAEAQRSKLKAGAARRWKTDK